MKSPPQLGWRRSERIPYSRRMRPGSQPGCVAIAPSRAFTSTLNFGNCASLGRFQAFCCNKVRSGVAPEKRVCQSTFEPMASRFISCMNLPNSASDSSLPMKFVDHPDRCVTRATCSIIVRAASTVPNRFFLFVEKMRSRVASSHFKSDRPRRRFHR